MKKQCDTCDKRATKVLDTVTSKWCASWFIGHYCDACFAEVEREMKLIVEAERVSALLDALIEIRAMDRRVSHGHQYIVLSKPRSCPECGAKVIDCSKSHTAPNGRRCDMVYGRRGWRQLGDYDG